MQWDGFADLESHWVLDAKKLVAGLRLIDLEPAVGGALMAAAARIAGGEQSLLRDWELLVKWFRSSAADPAPEGDTAEPLVGAIAYLACVPDLFRRQAARGIDMSVPRDAVIDLQRWILNYQRTNGEWGLAPRVYGWFRKLLHEVTITIGRLQYNPGPFGLAHLMRCDRDGRVVALAKDGLTCDADGYPCSEGDAFVTVFSLGAGVVKGHPFDADSGAILQDPVELPVNQWRQVVSPQSRVLFVHIPEGPAMTAEACDDSIRRAREFFPRYYPDVEWKAMVCVSWLVDPELLKVVPETSNIASFVRRFVPLACMNANDNQLWGRVFGGKVDPHTFTPATSLQRAILKHMQQGGRFRNTGGFIPDSLADQVL